jgi:hypothetical protein
VEVLTPDDKVKNRRHGKACQKSNERDPVILFEVLYSHQNPVNADKEVNYSQDEDEEGGARFFIALAVCAFHKAREDCSQSHNGGSYREWDWHV